MRREIQVFLFLLAILAAGGGDLYGQTSGLRFRAGLGYDYFSQQYFADTLASAGADSLALTTAIKTTYLDDAKAMLEARWSDSQRRVDLRTSLEQTPDLIRVKFQSNLKPKWTAFRLDWSTEITGQQRYRDSVRSGDEYVLGQTRAKLTYTVTPKRALYGQIRADAVGFGQKSAYIYNYHRAGASLGIMQSFANLSALNIEVFYLGRTVADSSNLDYDSYGLNTSYMGEVGAGQIDLSSRVERRDLSQTENQGDYLRFDLFGRSRWNLGGWWNTTQEFTVEGADYGSADPYNSDYWRVQADLLVGVEKEQVGVAFGPVLDLFDEQGTGVVPASDYLEAGAKGVLEYQRLGSVFLSLEPVLARRNVKNETEFQADFTTLRLGLIGDWSLGGRLGVNFLGLAEWEWYADDGQNNRVYLVSSGLTYSF